MNPTSDLLQTMADLGLTLGSVESMTGGLFAGEITTVPGASNVYKGGFVVYSNQEKTKLLNLNGAFIDYHGVVSGPVARELAIRGQKKLGVDVCVSVTGNAGPSAEEGKAAVGDFFLGLCYKGSCYVLPYHAEGTREEIRKAAVALMITFVRSLFPKEEN